MCYSAGIWADYRKYVKGFDAKLDVEKFFGLYWRRIQEPGLKIARGISDAFAEPETDDKRRIKGVIDEFEQQGRMRLEQELFAQRKRLADAERTPEAKPTKAAAESQRIAGNKITAALVRPSDFTRTEDLGRAEQPRVRVVHKQGAQGSRRPIC